MCIKKFVCSVGNLERCSCDNEGCCKVLTNYHTFRECDFEKHKICRDCYLKRYEECEPHSPKCPCCQSQILRLVKPSLDEDLVFIYVDNSNVWIEGKKLAAKQQKLKCVEDPRMRLDIGKVADVVANGRHVAWGVLYGSEPPPIDTVWNKIREFGWKVVTNKRSTIQNKEKQVDQQLVADIIALVCDKDIAKGKIAVISGDADVIPAIKEDEGWSFEIWMWETAISTGLKDLADKKPELLKIYILDSHLQSISFTNFTIDASQISSKLNSQSVVIENYRYDFVPNEDWQKGLTAKLGWPFQACTIGPKTLESSLGFKDLLLVFPKVKSKDDEDFINHFEKVFELLQQEYQGKVVNLPGYFQKNGSDAKICFTLNKFETLKDFDEHLSFNSAFSQNEAEERGQDRDQERQVEEKRQPDEDDDSSFQLVKSKHIKKKYQKYSEQCKHHSYCKKQLRCQWAHTDPEKKFFRNPGKCTLCRYYIKKNCRYGPSKCRFAHTDEDSYCRKCNQWGHLQDKCSLN